MKTSASIFQITMIFLIVKAHERQQNHDCRQVESGEQQCHRNKVLLNHVISNHTVENDRMCRVTCYLNPNCVSYNLRPSQTPGMMLCQLNNADRYQYPQDYQDKTGYSYKEWKLNKCHSNPCSINKTCQHGFSSEQYRCVCPKGVRCAAEYLLIEVESIGYDNDLPQAAKLIVNGIDYSQNTVGHNLASFHMNGTLISKTSYNTHKDSNAGAKMSAYINNLPDNVIVLVAVKDSGHRYVQDAYKALESIGATPPLQPNGVRATWCLIGHKGGHRPWIVQDQKDRYDVIAKVTAKILD